MTKKIALVAVCGFAASAFAQTPIIDGFRDASYGAPIVVQQVQTQFGDVDGSNPNGSELDAAYARVEGGRLYMMLTGNQEHNFNKLDVFFDSVAGGENTLSGTPDYDFNDNGNWISSNMNGMTFDTGFNADYHMISRWGNNYEVDFINRQGGTNAIVSGSAGIGSPNFGEQSSGTILAGNVGPNASGASLSQNLSFAIDNNNLAGVLGGTGAADQAAAAAVDTGMEFSIALADLGLPANFVGEIKIAAMINNGNHNYLSNQILGGLPGGQGNLGGDGSGGFTGDLSGVDFNNYAGNQYSTVQIVPAPASAALLGLGAFAGLRRRR